MSAGGGEMLKTLKLWCGGAALLAVSLVASPQHLRAADGGPTVFAAASLKNALDAIRGARLLGRPAGHAIRLVLPPKNSLPPVPGENPGDDHPKQHSAAFSEA